EGKPLHHLVDGDQQPAETKSHERSPEAVFDQFRPHLADGVAAHGGHAKKQYAQDPDRHNANAANRGRGKGATAVSLQFFLVSTTNRAGSGCCSVRSGCSPTATRRRTVLHFLTNCLPVPSLLAALT